MATNSAVTKGKILAVKIENIENNKIIIRVPYNQELIKKIKAFSGRRDGTQRKNTGKSFIFIMKR